MRAWSWIVVAVCGVAGVTASAEDWPELGKSQLGASAPDTGLAESWPVGGPSIVWETEGVGGGFAGPIVVAGRVYVMGRQIKGAVNNSWQGQEVQPGPDVLSCLDRATGKVMWRHEFAALTDKVSTAWNTPTADDQFVYARGGNGEIRCLSAKDGQMIWSWPKETKIENTIYHFAGGLYLHGDLLLFVHSPSLIALDRKTGEEKWTYKYPEMAIWGLKARNIILLDIQGRKCVLVSNDLLDPATGKKIGGLPPKSGGVGWWAVGQSNKLISACSTGITCWTFDSAADGTVTNKQVWEWAGTDKVKQACRDATYGGPLILGNRVFVWFTAAGNGPACLDLATGKELWWNHTNAVKSVAVPIGADGKLFISINGRLRMFAPTDKCLMELAAARVSRASMGPAAIADGLIYLRDGYGTVKCLDLRAKPEPPKAAPPSSRADAAGNWPQEDGPFGDGTAPDKELLDLWPTNGLNAVWEARSIPGTTVPIVADGRVFLVGQRDYGIRRDAQGQPPKSADGKIVYDNTPFSGAGPLLIACLDRKTGKELWQYAFASTGGVSSLTVPPLFDGGRVYAVDGPREIVCLNSADGTVVWRKLNPDGAPMAFPMRTERLALCGDRLVCAGPVRQEFVMTAMDKLTGEVVFTRFVEVGTGLMPVTPRVLRTPAGECLLQVFPAALTCVNSDGRVLGELQNDDMQSSNTYVRAIMTSGPRLYLQRKAGAECLEAVAGSDGALALRKLWTGEVYSAKMAIAAGDRLFLLGSANKPQLIKAQEAATGKPVWEGLLNNAVIVGGLVADHKLIVLTDKGELALIRADAPEFSVVSRVPIAGANRCWTGPVISDGQLFVRDCTGLVICLDLKKR